MFVFFYLYCLNLVFARRTLPETQPLPLNLGNIWVSPRDHTFPGNQIVHYKLRKKKLLNLRSSWHIFKYIHQRFTVTFVSSMQNLCSVKLCANILSGTAICACLQIPLTFLFLIRLLHLFARLHMCRVTNVL